MAMSGRSQRAVFLDRDGTLIEDLPYNVDPQRVELTPRAAEALYLLSSLTYQLIVVSNQPGIGLGYFSEAALAAVHRRIAELLARAGVLLTGFYYCPHRAEDRCACRKPQPGLLQRAAQEQGSSLRRSWLVGDILDDIEAGNRAGCRTILLDNGHETEWELSPRRLPDHLAGDLYEAACIITSADQRAGATRRW
jgi:histidinol-phosphate phosphatase family protein